MGVSIDKAREFLQKKSADHEAQLDQRFEDAMHDFEAIKRMIIEKYAPKRIYQWGSLMDRTRFKDYSDIDIAVEGIGGAERFFDLYGEAEKMTKFPLDVLEMEKIEPAFAALIRMKGRVVYEQ